LPSRCHETENEHLAIVAQIQTIHLSPTTVTKDDIPRIASHGLEGLFVVDTLTIFQEKGRFGGAIIMIKQKINVNWKLRFNFFLILMN